jgi:hypothetical protein
MRDYIQVKRDRLGIKLDASKEKTKLTALGPCSDRYNPNPIQGHFRDNCPWSTAINE